MSKLTLNDVGSGYNLSQIVNTNNQAIETALENTLSRDGTSPNQMVAALDMNSHRIVNLDSPVNATDAARFVDVTGLVSIVNITAPSQTGNAGKSLTTNGTNIAWTFPPTHYDVTSAEASASVTITNADRLPGDVRRYGNITGTLGNDTPILQAAINQSMQSGGAPWFVDQATTLSIMTSGVGSSTVSPVTAAITISSSCIGRIDGLINVFNNCAAILISGDNVEISGAGKIKHYGTFFQAGANNGSCIKVSGNNCHIDGLTVEDPPQYGIFLTSATAAGGKLTRLTILGGPTSFLATQHYGVEIEGPWRGLQIDDIQILPNAAGTGRCVEGLASGTNGGLPDSIQVSNIFGRGMWDHATYLYCNNSVLSNFNAYQTGGSGIKVVCTGTSCSSFHATDTVGGGIDLCNFAGSTLTSFSATDYQGIGISLEQLDSAVDNSLSRASIVAGSVRGKAATTTVRGGIRFLTTFSGTATSQKDILFSDIHMSNCAQSAVAEGAIQLQVGAGKTLSNIRVEKCTVDTTGWQGVEFVGGGTFTDCTIDDVIIRDPGAHAAAVGSDTHGLRIQAAGTVLTGGLLTNITTRDTRGGGAKMAQGFSNVGTMTGVAFDKSCRSYAHTVASGLDGLRTGAGAIQLDSPRVRIATTAADALTLADGFDGQELELYMTSDGGNGTLNATNEGNFATITFDDVGDSASMKFLTGKWYFIGGTATRA